MAIKLELKVAVNNCNVSRFETNFMSFELKKACVRPDSRKGFLPLRINNRQVSLSNFNKLRKRNYNSGCCFALRLVFKINYIIKM